MTKRTNRLRQESGTAKTEYGRRIALLQCELSRESHKATNACDQLTHESAALLGSQRKFCLAQERVNAEALKAPTAAEARARAQDDLAEARKKLAVKEELLAAHNEQRDRLLDKRVS